MKASSDTATSGLFEAASTKNDPGRRGGISAGGLHANPFAKMRVVDIEAWDVSSRLHYEQAWVNVLLRQATVIGMGCRNLLLRTTGGRHMGGGQDSMEAKSVQAEASLPACPKALLALFVENQSTKNFRHLGRATTSDSKDGVFFWKSSPHHIKICEKNRGFKRGLHSTDGRTKTNLHGDVRAPCCHRRR